MKSINIFLSICLMAICICGCNRSSYDEISQTSSEREAIMAVFGEYNSTNGTGVVQMSEKENKKDRTYIYYLARVPALDSYKNILKQTTSTKQQEEILQEMYNKVQEEVTQNVISKIDKLYTNKNVNKIRIEAGVQWPYGNHNYMKPGEKIVGSKIAYIKTFNFTRENYAELLKKYE